MVVNQPATMANMHYKINVNIIAENNTIKTKL